MARDATARLYDVDEHSVVYKRPKKRGKYDHGTVTFRAKKGKLIDLDKLHESIWATRLSGGTRSGLVTLDVTAVGTVVVSQNETVLKVSGSDRHFVLVENPDIEVKDGAKTPFQQIRAVIGRGEKALRVTGRIAGWNGRWPGVLSKLPAKPRRLKIQSFQIVEE